MILYNAFKNFFVFVSNILKITINIIIKNSILCFVEMCHLSKKNTKNVKRRFKNISYALLPNRISNKF